MKEKIKVAVVGVGNCASSLIQGVTYYKDHTENDIPGLMHVTLGGYHVSDIEFVAGFDINDNKVGKDIADAIWAEPNNAHKFSEVEKTGNKVYRGQTLDGVGKFVAEKIPLSADEAVDPLKILKETGAEIIVNYLPVGSQKATEYWADIALKAGCGFVNCIPVFIASDHKWEYKFRKAKLPIIGDDIKSQVGATIVHRTLANLYLDRGMPVERTYQLNTGGNMDFMNMLEIERLKSKKISKTNAVSSQLDARGKSITADNIHVGPSDYVPWQKDNKICFIRIESTHFGDVPTYIDVRLSVEDSPNSAGVVIDAIRCMKLALNNKVGGALVEPSSYFMKSPPYQFEDREARNMVAEFIKENS